MFPANDDQFEESLIAKVTKHDDGWTIRRAEGWSFYVQSDSKIVPEEGMLARFYGKGIGSSVRGLFINGVQVFYRTEDEEKKHSEIQIYGADAADWLKRWDDGRTCWSIEMGGLGPGYEQCIHITMAEILRHLIEKSYDVKGWADPDQWKADLKQIENAGFANDEIKKLGLSGAQWGAAVNLATKFYKHGPIAILTDEKLKSRHIQVGRGFPGS